LQKISAKKHLEGLQLFRGFAALAVALHHARLGTSAFVQEIPAPIEALLGQGFLGVDFFFVLSGFIILHTHYDDPRSVSAAAVYAFKRITRIYLPYLPITGAVIIAYLLFPALSQSDRTWGWFTSLTLLPSIHEPALPVAWTLVHEIVFYLLFLVFFVSRRIFAASIACGAVCSSNNPFICRVSTPRFSTCCFTLSTSNLSLGLFARSPAVT
jgi:peptidoglycan/LPS O-acetylase OafA/YrhL